MFPLKVLFCFVTILLQGFLFQGRNVIIEDTSNINKCYETGMPGKHDKIKDCFRRIFSTSPSLIKFLVAKIVEQS